VSAVNGVDLDIAAGETVAVVGGSGSGKTTLGRAMLRLIPISGGEIRFQGRDVTATIDARFRLASQLVFQDPYSSLDPRMRVGEIVAEPLRHVPQLAAGERDRRVEAMLEEVGLTGLGSAGRMNCPAVSGSGSRSHAPSCASRPSWSRTSRLGSRHDHPGPGAEIARAAPAAIWLRLPVHQP